MFRSVYAISALLVMIAATAAAADPTPPKYNPVDKATVAAYEKFRGAHYGVLIPSEYKFHDREISDDDKDIANGGLPGFKFSFGLPDDKMPSITVPHGMSLRSTKMTDADLAKLKGGKNLVWLDLSGNDQFANAGLKELAGLKSLQSLDLGSTSMQDASLKDLQSLENLTTLILFWNKDITDAGIRELVGLKKLKRLDLTMAKLTDEGLKNLTALDQLTSLNIQWTTITDAGMIHLTQFKKLRHLNIAETKVTSEGIKELAGMTGLTSLDVHYTKAAGAGGIKTICGLSELTELVVWDVADADMAEVRRLKKLTTLDIKGSTVTDAGLAMLMTVKTLTVLKVPKGVTDAGVKKFQVALPKCVIERN